MGVRVVEIDGLQVAASDARLAQSGLLTPVSALRARSGVLGAPVVCTAQATPSMVVTVPAFAAAVDNNSFGGSFGGPVVIVNDAPLNVTISAASGTNPRVDLIVAKWVDESAGVGARGGFIVPVPGTPATVPVAPAMPANSFLLATIAVGTSVTVIRNADITNPQVTTTALGGITPSRTGTDVAGAFQDQYRSVAGKLQVYRGTTWQRPTFDGEVAATSVSFASGWAGGGSVGRTLSYSRSASGQTTLAGTFYNQAASSGSAYVPGPTIVVTTLPGSVAPPLTVTATGAFTTGGAETGVFHVDIQANGKVIIQRAFYVRADGTVVSCAPGGSNTVPVNSFHSFAVGYDS